MDIAFIKMKNIKSALVAITLLSAVFTSDALRLEKIKYADFGQWITRSITESKVLGGATKKVYEIGPTQSIVGNKPYANLGGSPWATSNVYAKVVGIVKASNSVTPFDRGGGNKCVKMSAIMEEVKVLGIVNMDVMVQGTIFLGRIYEPITSTSTPYSKMEMGMPYTKRPTALVFDYKVDMPNTDTRIKSTGFGSKKVLKGRDCAEVYCLLQRRWEDKDGNLYAKRVGTGRERFYKSTGWINGHQLKIHYGDITKQSFYKSWMGLLSGDKAVYARNSKGKLVPVNEVGWDDANATPTHVLVMASCASGVPFVGTEGLTFYFDNAAFGF